MFFANTVVVASHRRSGMQWTIDALRNNSADINDSYMSLEQMEADHDGAIPLAKFRRQLLNMDGRVLINVHELPSAESWRAWTSVSLRAPCCNTRRRYMCIATEETSWSRCTITCSHLAKRCATNHLRSSCAARPHPTVKQSR